MSLKNNALQRVENSKCRSWKVFLQELGRKLGLERPVVVQSMYIFKVR